MQKGDYSEHSAHSTVNSRGSPQQSGPEDFRTRLRNQAHHSSLKELRPGKWHSAAEAVTETGPLRGQTARERRDQTGERALRLPHAQNLDRHLIRQ